MTPTRSIVLSGGGARGAYEVGVMAYVMKELPPELLEKAPIRLLCGTSVGAVHACFLGASAHMPQANIDVLLQHWRDLRLESLLRFRARDLMRLPWEIRQALNEGASAGGVLIDTAPLQRLVTQEIPWRRLQQNLESGRLDAVTVSATHIYSGRTMVFVDRPRGGVPPWTRDARRAAVAARIGPLHALASAAIPVLFPPIGIDGAFYCDGGLRQNTPLSPALRLGADRVLVVPVGHGGEQNGTWPPGRAEAYPRSTLLVGKVLNALLLDHLDYDLAQLRGFNRLLEEGTSAFGNTFVEQINRSAETIRGARYRQVDTVVIRPSRDLGAMASEFVNSGVLQLSGVSAWMVNKLSEPENADLLSYMCFDGRFAEALIQLGMTDADASREQLLAFFRD